jgi:UDP-N-acetylglucosamine 2-epimerase
MELTEVRKNGSSVWVSIVGARPQFVKLAPVCRAIDAYNRTIGASRIDHRILHTGQHYDHNVADLLFKQMGIPEPTHNLAVGSGSHGTQLARMLSRMEPLLSSKKIDWVIVYGDTNSTLAGSLLASRLKLPLAHVEAGCRSEDAGMPEEQNRIVADHLSQLLLAPSKATMNNLHREGIGTENDARKRRTTIVGDVMYDALLQHVPLADRKSEDNFQQFELRSKGYYLLTLHRAENTNNVDRLASILQAVSSLDLPVLFPVHPRTKQILGSAGVSLNGRLRPIDPLGYLEMLAAEKHALKILTDSGGVQKEAFYLRVPCITLRERTEWPETVELGANRIAGTTPDAIRDAVNAAHSQEWAHATPYGDGTAAQRIVDELLAASNHKSLPN